jgi:hypothetical protein
MAEQTIQSYMDAFAKQLAKDLRDSLDASSRSKNKNSRLAASIKPFYREKNGNIIVGVTMNEYWYWVDEGRQPGDVSESADILGWMKRKGIDPRRRIEDMREEQRTKSVKKKRIAKLKPLSYETAAKSFAYIVKRKITREGYAATHFVSKVLNDGRMERMRKDIAELFNKKIVIELNKK